MVVEEDADEGVEGDWVEVASGGSEWLRRLPLKRY